MFDIRRHRQEALRRLQEHDYEIGPQGLLIKKMDVLFHGHFEVAVNDEPFEIADNLVVNEGLLDILSVYFDQGTQHSAFYISLFSGNVTPGATLTAATYVATCTEFTTYDETTRVLWANDAAAANSIGNNTTPAVFTMSTGGPYTVRGAAIHNISTKSATSGKLPAAARFSVDKTLAAAEELRVKYIFNGSSS